MVLGINEIKQIIPHRSPFLLIDKVEITGKKTAVAYKAVTYNEPYFTGHFPEEPVMPGVLIMEALAQTGAVILLNDESLKGRVILFGGINKARFRKKVVPGTLLRLEIEITKQKGIMGIGQGRAYDGDDLVADGELMFVIQA